MNTLLAVCAVVVTAAVVVAVIYLVQTLISVRKAAGELETLLKNVNSEVAAFTTMTARVRDLVKKITSPWAQAGGWIGGIVSSFVRHKREEQQQL